MTEHNTVVPTDVPTEEPSMEAAIELIELKKADRCDTCGAQAFVLTMHSGHELLWCKHHFEAVTGEKRDELDQALVIDARAEINQKPSVGAY